jgi:hypothetical protein
MSDAFPRVSMSNEPRPKPGSARREARNELPEIGLCGI